MVGVSESGLRSRDDVTRLTAAGYRAFLVGERFMTDPDPARALQELTDDRSNVRERSERFERPELDRNVWSQSHKSFRQATEPQRHRAFVFSL